MPGMSVPVMPSLKSTTTSSCLPKGVAWEPRLFVANQSGTVSGVGDAWPVKGRQVAVTTPGMVVVVAVFGITPGQKRGPAASAAPGDKITFPAPATKETVHAAAQWKESDGVVTSFF